MGRWGALDVAGLACVTPCAGHVFIRSAFVVGLPAGSVLWL
jgi:ammonia channel protein AmtB